MDSDKQISDHVKMITCFPDQVRITGPHVHSEDDMMPISVSHSSADASVVEEKKTGVHRPDSCFLRQEVSLRLIISTN